MKKPTGAQARSASKRGKVLGRRRFLQVVAGSAMAGTTLATSPLAAAAALQGATQDKPGPSAAAIRVFYGSLSDAQKKAMCFDWDHVGFTKLPLRLHVTAGDGKPMAGVAISVDKYRSEGQVLDFAERSLEVLVDIDR